GRGKREFTDVVLQLIRRLNDKVEQDHYATVLAGIIGVSEEAMRAKLLETPKGAVARMKRTKEVQPESREVIEQRTAEQHLLSLLLMQPGLRPLAEFLTPDMFTHEPARQLFAFLQENPDFNGNKSQLHTLHSIGDYVKIASLQFDELYRSLEITELQYEVTRLQERLVAHYVRTQKQQIAEKLVDADEDETHRLLTLDKDLNNLLRQVKDTHARR